MDKQERLMLAGMRADQARRHECQGEFGLAATRWAQASSYAAAGGEPGEADWYAYMGREARMVADRDRAAV